MPNPASNLYQEFVLEGYHFDAASSALSLDYRFQDGPRFRERVDFDFPVRQLSEGERAALDRIFQLILLFSGISYYKAFIPRTVRCEAFPLDQKTAEFVQAFYVNGLAEFAFRNGISLRDHIEVIWSSTAAPVATALELPRRTCIPVGGGKDSVVTIECLRQESQDPVLFTLGDSEPIAACLAVAELPFIRVNRRLDASLFDLNENGALNGHVPITGILSAIVVAAAVLFGFDTIAMSNEHSASVPNLTRGGDEVNHQFSKSLDFERGFADYISQHISPSIAYFSFLRPLSEIEIARRFARSPKYFSAFRSCNTAFKQLVEARGRQWCCDCPKCRFVFLALTPFVAKGDLIGIFGRNLLEDETQQTAFAELCGLIGHKPFECVGDVSESLAVMSHLGQHPDWCHDRVVRGLHADFPALKEAGAGRLQTVLRSSHPHRVPDAYMQLLRACG
jgi:UDP-N-acetyl-alpha-D-muramoyl-L-alanyl-L-glutamate epimerase